jgi:hypothetical protein
VLSNVVLTTSCSISFQCLSRGAYHCLCHKRSLMMLKRLLFIDP